MVRKIWARYYDLITTMDKQVGELLGQLEADGLAQNTIVFFFADHGLGLPRFKRTLYDTGLRVPLIVRVPPRYEHLAPPATGGQTDQLVSFVDFAPTVLNLAGVPVPPYMQGQPFLGQTPAAPREYVFATHSRVDEAYDMSRCVRDKRYKYIRNFMPHLPYVQPSDYCDQAEIMQELRRVAKEGGMAGLEKLVLGADQTGRRVVRHPARSHRGQEPGRLARTPADSQPPEKAALGLDGRDEGRGVAAGGRDAPPGRRLDAV